MFDKKTQCELCHHDTCVDVGVRNIHRDGVVNKCTRFQPDCKEVREEKSRKAWEAWQDKVDADGFFGQIEKFKVEGVWAVGCKLQDADAAAYERARFVIDHKTSRGGNKNSL